MRKDENSRKLINDIWERRNTVIPNAPSYCPTLGVCEKQFAFHEQQALSDIIKEQPGLVDKVISVLRSRDTASPTRSHLALNTLERKGAFAYAQGTGNWERGCFSFAEDDERYHSGQWREGDWMGQTSGIPVLGYLCNEWNLRRISDEIYTLREDKTKDLIAKVVR